MWFEREIVFRELVPHGVELVYFARIRLQQVLKNATRRSRNIRIFDCNVLVLHDDSEGKDCRKLRADVVGRVARNAAKQRQQPDTRIGARAVVTLLVGKRHPLVPFVLNVA